LSKYTGTTDHKFLKLPNHTLGVYNLWDSWVTASLVKPLLAELEENRQLDYYRSDIEPLQYSVLDMMERGLLLDARAATNLKSKMTRTLNECDNIIRRAADETGFEYTDKFPNAKAQVGRFLFQHLGLRGGKRTPKGRDWSSDQDALNRALKQLRKRDEKHRLVLHALFHRSRVQTVRSRYLNLHADLDGRVRANFKLLHAKTWRYAIEDPPLQQFPEEARHVFVSAPGMVFVGADYSQVEARILAYLARDRASIEAFEKGEDVHAQNARDLFGWSPQEWDLLDVDMRASARGYAKAFLYRLVYGGSAETGDKKLFCPCDRWGCSAHRPSTLTLKREEAVRVERRWLAKHHPVVRFQRETYDKVSRYHYYDPPLGGRRHISKPRGKELEREVANIPMQTTAAQVINRAQIKLHALGVPLVLQKHDELIAECKDEDAPRVARLMKTVMEEHIPELGTSFPVDLSVGRNWAHQSPENPGGMREWQTTSGLPC
jgi:DNA polymerase-1